MLNSFKNGGENGYKKWHFEHRDGHTTQKVKKIVVSKTHLSRKTVHIFLKVILMSKLKKIEP